MRKLLKKISDLKNAYRVLEIMDKAGCDIEQVSNMNGYYKLKPNCDIWYYLLTPDSVPSGCGSGNVQYVRSNGRVTHSWCGAVGAVLPFFILKSDIFVF